jgi:UDP-2-acetamido-3-amino-2,3-dideoxy-glucuronate N-acetyltransferase
VFTNDRFPRATDPELRALRSSAIDEHTRPTLVRRGATIGANCTIGNDLTIGAFAMVGMGAVVTKDVPDHALVVGNPARVIGFVCRCGEPVSRAEHGTLIPDTDGTCAACGRPFALRGGRFADGVPERA